MKSSDWPATKVSRLLNIALPIIQAPMAGGATTPELVAAVSNAGGLGSLGAGYMTAHELRSSIKKIKLLCNKPFSVNLFIPEKHEASEAQIEKAKRAIEISCPELNFNVPPIKPPFVPSFEEQMNVLLEEKISVFSFTFGILSDNWIEKFKENNTLLIGTATTLEEAQCLEETNVDAIVAQSREAGGHRGTFLGRAEEALISLSPFIQLLVVNTNVPIIAAGGIMDAKGIAASLMLGACAVQMGTAFLCCMESGIHPLYKKILLNSLHDNTTLTRAFSGKLARGINNKFIMRMDLNKKDILDYPIQNSLTRAMRKEAEKQNNTDFMSMWAGQSAYLCKKLSASEFIQELNDEVIEELTLMNNIS